MNTAGCDGAVGAADKARRAAQLTRAARAKQRGRSSTRMGGCVVLRRSRQ